MGVGDAVLPGTSAKVARWIARGVAILAGILNLFILLDVSNKLRRMPLPFMLSDAPFGTWEQSTQLGYIVLAAASALLLLGALLAFRWEAKAVRILLVAAAGQLLWWAFHFFDPTFPHATLAAGLALGFLPPLVIAGLLIVIRQKDIA